MSAGGSRWGRWRGALALAAALVLVVPAHALAAKDTYRVPGGSLTYGIVFGSNGYRIRFSEWEGGHGSRFKTVAEGHHATITYATAAGRDPLDGIAANLGRRGSFDLRPGRMGKLRTLPIPSYCGGPRGTWRRGYIVGGAHFHGERAYTDARIRRVPVVTESWPAFHCHYLKAEPPGKPRRAQVTARQGQVGFGAVLLSRSAAPADRRVLFRAWMSHRGRVSIYRELKVPAPESSLTFPGGPKLPEEVSVDPPSPFRGSATFTRSPESTFSWSGDLTVAFPGLDPIRLAGPRFEARVCALRGCVDQHPERPERESPP